MVTGQPEARYKRNKRERNISN